MLGTISRKYESGKFGPGAISNIPGDPGGKSYGIYQFSSTKGILGMFVDFATFNELREYALGSECFDKIWKELAKNPKFEEAQHQFAKTIYFTKIRNYCTKQGVPDTEAVNEALFSIAIQHGKWQYLIDTVIEHCDVEDEVEFIKTLYQVRTEYVYGLKLPEQIKKNIINKRYPNELQDVLKLVRK